ncbi:nuclear transport factor 2 family protein [Hypericibacter sp.]|uniref:nuclear transport factor 2 family protein n=1 Tax=Hypericibacter sp. TaxID=2705401 RepID=UPI003D6C7314
MRSVLMAISIALLLIAPASASDAGVFSRVERFIDAWNRNDAAGVTDCMSASPTIIDDFPPHYWSGSSALVDWGKDYAILMNENDITDPRVMLSRPTIIDVHGTKAYVVVPATYSYKQHARPMQEKGILTVALEGSHQGWRITAFAWTKQ